MGEPGLGVDKSTSRRGSRAILKVLCRSEAKQMGQRFLLITWNLLVKKKRLVMDEWQDNDMPRARRKCPQTWRFALTPHHHYSYSFWCLDFHHNTPGQLGRRLFMLEVLLPPSTIL
jgi:hypothetical protein